MFLPKTGPYVSSEESLFGKLVEAGECQSQITLPYELHLFLVSCLVEHMRDAEIVHHTLALSFLEYATNRRVQGNLLLKRAGDEALLLAGLFPERALRLNVSSSYFRHMGQSAYATLAANFFVTGKPEVGKFYDAVTINFSSLEKVLDAARARPDTEWGAFIRFRARIQ